MMYFDARLTSGRGNIWHSFMETLLMMLYGANIHSVIHMPPWCVRQGGFACGCVARVRGAQVQRALGVCVVVRVVTRSFIARGEIARRSPSAERGDGHTPTLRVDTHRRRAPHAHTHNTCLTPTDLPGGETHQGSRGSTDQRSLCKLLPLAASWIWSYEGQKNSGATRQDGKVHGAKCSKIRAENLYTGGHPST